MPIWLKWVPGKILTIAAARQPIICNSTAISPTSYDYDWPFQLKTKQLVKLLSKLCSVTYTNGKVLIFSEIS